MLPLEARKIRILQAIVHDYVQTTRPVGSERLIEVYGLMCKPATVRNEMADLAAIGYITQPHTSAGRIPTDQGYRYYVDTLMKPVGALQESDTQRVRDQYKTRRADVEALIVQTCRLLSEITSYTSMATDPASTSDSVRRIFVSAASPRHLLLVVLLATGHVEHRMIEASTLPEEGVLTHIVNLLNGTFAGNSLEDLKTLSTHELPDGLAQHARVIKSICSAIKQVAASCASRRVFVEGANQFLRQPEFHDVQRLENLLSALEEQNVLYSVLSQALPQCDPTVVIGTENQHPRMQDCSIVSTPYKIGERTAGYLGVLGPTRMNYDRASAAVGLVAQSLSQVLTNLWNA